MHPSPIADALSTIVFGPEVICGNVVMLPLISRGTAAADPARPPYLVLDDALARGEVEVTEVSAHGSVPELRVVNRGDKATLILDGEELVGAKQNRIVNLTIIVAARSALTIPVSCVEAGRWSARSRAFAAAPRTQYASGRAKRMAQVTACMRADRGYRSDQSEVWADIAEKSARLRVSSPTGAMDAIFAANAEPVEAFVEALRPVAGQVGAMFFVGGRIASIDVFDSEVTLRKLLPKLVRSVAVDAIDDGGGTNGGTSDPPFAVSEAAQFLASLRGADVHAAPALGLGQDVRLTAPGLTGAALVVDGKAVHVSAFAQ